MENAFRVIWNLFYDITVIPVIIIFQVEDDSEEKEAVEKAIIAVQAAAGHDLACRAPGEKEHPVMRHSLDPIKYKHRPFIVYLATHCFVNDIVGALIMRSLGFRKYHTRHLSYWHRPGSYSLRQRKMDDSNSNRTPHTSPTAQQQVPIVFVHGIGLGLTLYAEFIRYFTTRTDIFLLELPHASLKVWEFVPTSSQTVDSILEMLNTHGFEKAVFAAHSLGSVYVSWMCRYASHAVAASVFIEPICFMLFLRTLTFNFLYQEYGGFVGFLIRSEFFLNHALRRHFWWQSKILWAEDIHHPCHIFLCHQDEVVPTQEVVKYIATHDKAHHITTEMIDDDFHGSWLFKPNIYAHVAETIENVWMSCSSSPFSSLSTEAPSTRLTKSKRKMRFIPAYGLVRKGYIYLTRRQRRSRGQEQRDSDLAQRKGKINRIAPAFS